jgi:hypothetical protein
MTGFAGGGSGRLRLTDSEAKDYGVTWRADPGVDVIITDQCRRAIVTSAEKAGCAMLG